MNRCEDYEKVAELLPVPAISSRPGQNGRHFVDDIFRSISVNEKFCILITVSLKSVLKSPVDNNTILV